MLCNEVVMRRDIQTSSVCEEFILFVYAAIPSGVQITASCAQWNATPTDGGESTVWSTEDYV